MAMACCGPDDADDGEVLGNNSMFGMVHYLGRATLILPDLLVNLVFTGHRIEVGQSTVETMVADCSNWYSDACGFFFIES